MQWLVIGSKSKHKATGTSRIVRIIFYNLRPQIQNCPFNILNSYVSLIEPHQGMRCDPQAAVADVEL